MTFQRKIDKLEMTHKELAKALDISERQVRRYVAGADVPRVVTLAMVALNYFKAHKT